MQHGYYWVERYKNDRPSIALLTKSSGWKWVGGEQWHKMVKKEGETHPHKILQRIEDYENLEVKANGEPSTR